MVSPIIYSNMATSAHKQADSFPPIAEVKGRNIFTYWEGRRKWNANHGMEKLWRVHDGLYDLSGFNHPGGKSWLDLTKGTDVTELFESHHLDIEKARAVLAKYYVRDADWPRESPLTFEPDGFYSILRDRVFKKVKEVGKMPPVLSKLITDGTAIAYLGLLAAATYRRSLPLAVLAGCAQGALAVAAHNFGHRNNWRKHYMDLAGRAHRFWRTHHEVSHHMFPNSSLDIEVPGGEAAMGVSFFIDGPRSNRSRAWGLLRMLTNFVAAQIKPTILAPFFSGFKVEQLNYILLLLMIALRRRSPQPHSRSLRGALETIGIWSLGRGISTLWLWFTGTLAGHYSDDAWRQGETAPDLKDIKDFGLFQIETCGDRIESYSPNSDLLLPVILLTFSDHTLHHLFPALDHAYLRYAYPALAQTCNEFGVRFEFRSTGSMLRSTIDQTSRIEPLAAPRRTKWDGRYQDGWVDERTGFRVGAQ